MFVALLSGESVVLRVDVLDCNFAIVVFDVTVDGFFGIQFRVFCSERGTRGFGESFKGQVETVDVGGRVVVVVVFSVVVAMVVSTK